MFKTVLLVSSSADSIIPYSSARIETCEKALEDAKHGVTFLMMLENMLSVLEGTCDPMSAQRALMKLQRKPMLFLH